ncbi:MAG: Gfo/Idh/MocA family protein [Verrucomicrobiales bacterium]
MPVKFPSRRQFLKASFASSLTFQVVPSRVFGANQRVAVASVGVGGKGASDIAGAKDAGADIVGLCDVDSNRLGAALKKYPGAEGYGDFRKMLEKMGKSIDAVTVSTPDHMHFHAALTAIRMGKHVYCQKPLTHSIWEARTLAEAAAEHKVVTQMGNQAHAGEAIRRAVELIRAGIVGKVTGVHAWTNRPIWPQGMSERLPKQEVPANLDWEQWIGPAPMRDFNTGYAPFKWRGWWDFGTGALGDMGCHIMDMPFWAIDIKHPIAVEAVQEGNSLECGPKRSTVTYTFPEGEYSRKMPFVWYDGGAMPDQSVFEGTVVDAKSAKKFDLIVIGEKGKFLFNRSSTKWMTSPGELEKQIDAAQSIPRVKNEDQEWIDAIRGEGGAPLSGFDRSGPFTETVLLGNLAIRLGKKLDWDGGKLKATNAPEADAIIRRKYREGWEI